MSTPQIESRPLSNRELATVLAALRYWQNELDQNDFNPSEGPHFEGVAPLSADEIDHLCERLNVPPAARAGAESIINDLLGALSSCDDQIGQMRGMFDDEDGTIQEAVDSADEATAAARDYLAAARPRRIAVTVEGGAIQEVFCADDTCDLVVVEIDYDTEDTARDDLDMVAQDGGKAWQPARVIDWKPTLGVIPDAVAADDARFDEHFA